MNLSDTIIQLVVTQGVGVPELLNVHRDILCKSPKFFQNAVKPEWTNMQAALYTIDLPEHSIATVSDYVQWLYYDKISINLE
ncbi:hypothetical protein G6011_07903 [Alternaria panax]|uniref:BTB domain-containing protein n=1 Tax=Alternaria panax TaxID=48097 RepID=A0AAD4FD90_9PLEO|nr:hypothetical protein G6011_07903 [Alternaria panax]